MDIEANGQTQPVKEIISKPFTNKTLSAMNNVKTTMTKNDTTFTKKHFKEDFNGIFKDGDLKSNFNGLNIILQFVLEGF